MNFILVLILGAVGGIVRSIFGTSVAAILAVNLIGTFCLGLFSGVADSHNLKPWLHDGISAGLLGSFTTFSSFATGVVELGANHMWIAGLYVVGTIVGGICLAYLGARISETLLGTVTGAIRRRRAMHQIKP